MIKTIELYEKYQKFSSKLICNDKSLQQIKDSNHHLFHIDQCPAHICIEISPHKIKPLVRFNGVAVNYGLAGITPWDHILEFTLCENFFDRYFDSIINAKQQYLGVSKEELFQKIGYQQNYDHLIKKIKEKLQ